MGAILGTPEGPPCSCDLSLVIWSAKQLEDLLESKFEATGRGLHEKINSVRDLPDSLKYKLRRVATIRNKLVHEKGFDRIPDREKFVGDVQQQSCETQMKLTPRIFFQLKDFDTAKEELAKIARDRGIDVDSIGFLKRFFRTVLGS